MADVLFEAPLMPLMPQSIGSIIGSLVTTAVNLATLARDIANAPAHIQRLCNDAELCRTRVLTIKALLYQIETKYINDDVQELIYISTLARALFACQEVLDLLKQEVEGLMRENMRIGKDNQARWVWREEEIERYSKALELRLEALNIALNILNGHQGREVRKQNTQILNCVTGMAGDKSGNLLPPQEAIRNIAAIDPTGSRLLSTLKTLPLSRVHETESAWEPKPACDGESSTRPKPAGDGECSTKPKPSGDKPSGDKPSGDKPAGDAESSTSTSIEMITYLNKSSTSAPNARTFIEASQNRLSEPNSPLLYSKVTWSELRHSGASIFSYQSRSSLCAVVALVKTRARAPVAILTKNRKRLNKALLEATTKENITAMSIFLEYGADINAVQSVSTKITPLDLAIERGNIDIVRFLLIHGANVNVVKWFTRIPRHVALQADIVKLLLQHGADIEAITNNGETVLFTAARLGRLEDMKALLEAGADCNKKNIDSKRPLHGAAINNWRSHDPDPEVVKLLLQYGADIDAIDNSRETALTYAAQYSRFSIVKALLEAGADCNKTMDEKHETPLFSVARKQTPYCLAPEENLKMMEIFLKAGADCNKKNIDGKTLLHIACCDLSYTICHNPRPGPGAHSFDERTYHSCSLPMVTLLLRYGAEIVAMDNKNETPLFKAVWIESLDIVEVLLEAGADCNKENIDGKTPLHIAIGKYDPSSMVKLLIKYGADIEAVDNKYETACSG